MGDAADLTVEILKQIRDGVFEMKAEVTSLRNDLNSLRSETHEGLARLETKTEQGLAAVREEVSDLRRTVARVARVNDETLSVALDDSGRMDALEGRVGTLEADVKELRERPPR